MTGAGWLGCGKAGRPAALAAALAAGIGAAGCFTLGSSIPGEPRLRPAVQRLGQNSQAVGNAVVVTVGGAVVRMEPLEPEQLDALYQNRPGLVNPLKGLSRDGPPPLAFRVDLRNRGRQPVQVEPAQFLLTDQEGIRRAPLSYQDFYELVSQLADADRRLRSVQATVLSSFLTIPPGAEREGFLFFPPLSETARLVVLELGSFYLGAREVPVLAEFEVARSKAPPKP
jgi:hypothetical protein